MNLVSDSLHRRRLFNVSGAYRSRYWTAAAWMLAGLALSGFVPAGELRQWLVPLALAAGTGIGLGRLRAARLSAERALAEEQRFGESLPFRLDGWWSLLAEDWSESSSLPSAGIAYTRVRVTIVFQGRAPEAKALHERFLAARLVELRNLDAEGDGAELVIAVGRAERPSALHGAVHRLLGVLADLHAKHPIERVLLSSASPGL